MNREELLRKMYDLTLKGEIYLMGLPEDLVEYITNNTYTTSLGRVSDVLIDHIFGEWVDDICWFLYRGDYAVPFVIEEKGEKIVILGIDQFIDYLKKYKNFS